MRMTATAVILSFLVSCSTKVPVQTRSLPDSGGTVTVNVVGACPARSLSGATVELRSSKGVILAEAITGSDGAVAFSQEMFRSATLVIVCHEDFFCGVIQLTTHDGKAFFIALAPAMLSSTKTHDGSGRATVGAKIVAETRVHHPPERTTVVRCAA